MTESGGYIQCGSTVQDGDFSPVLDQVMALAATNWSDALWWVRITGGHLEAARIVGAMLSHRCEQVPFEVAQDLSLATQQANGRIFEAFNIGTTADT